jgi:hypothetical protein
VRDDFTITNVNPRDGMIFKESKQPHYIRHFRKVEDGIRWDLEYKTVVSVTYIAGGVAPTFDEAKTNMARAIRDHGGPNANEP